MAEASASLASLPTEIADSIYKLLLPSDLARLARVSKEIYAAIQGPLYRRPIINSYRKLQNFVKTLNSVASWDKSGNPRSKRVINLTLLIDPAKEETASGRPLIAVLLSRLITVISGYNPSITITLAITHSSCTSQPVRSFETETFPRVTSLVLDLGHESNLPSAAPAPSSSSLDTVIPIRRSSSSRYYNNTTTGNRCLPNTKFWTRFFNGSSFPHLQKLELHHRSGRGPAYGAYEGWESSQLLFTPADVLGLAKIEKLVVDEVPEFNDAVLMAGLQNAPKLTNLHIENCHLTYDALEKLLVHALPVLQHFTLRIPAISRFAKHARDGLNSRSNVNVKDLPHLCPLFRKYGQDLKTLDFAAPFICRDIFLDDYEKAKLHESGHPGVLSGDKAGNTVAGELDVLLMTGILRRLRARAEATSSEDANNSASSYEAISAALERERLIRNRKKLIGKERWKRRFHVLEGMCRNGDTFDELAGLAEVGEEGIRYVMAHQPGKRAISFKNGLEREEDYIRLFAPYERERRTVNRRTAGFGHDHNDNQQ